MDSLPLDVIKYNIIYTRNFTNGDILRFSITSKRYLVFRSNEFWDTILDSYMDNRYCYCTSKLDALEFACERCKPILSLKFKWYSSKGIRREFESIFDRGFLDWNKNLRIKGLLKLMILCQKYTLYNIEKSQKKVNVRLLVSKLHGSITWEFIRDILFLIPDECELISVEPSNSLDYYNQLKQTVTLEEFGSIELSVITICVSRHVRYFLCEMIHLIKKCIPEILFIVDHRERSTESWYDKCRNNVKRIKTVM